MAETGIQQRSSGSTVSTHPATTTISTIAVQSGATRIVVALLQVKFFISKCQNLQ